MSRAPALRAPPSPAQASVMDCPARTPPPGLVAIHTGWDYHEPRKSPAMRSDTPQVQHLVHSSNLLKRTLARHFCVCVCVVIVVAGVDDHGRELELLGIRTCRLRRSRYS